MTTHIGEDVAATSAERALALRLVSLALASPTGDRLAEIDLLAEALIERRVLQKELAALRDILQEVDLEDLAAAHERLFGGAVAVSPYEGSYESDPFRQARQLADVAGFYAAFGSRAAGPAAERPDHAGAELEFLAFLALRRVEALARGRAEEATLCSEIEASFIAAHAGRWLPGFFRALGGGADSPFHLTVAALGERVVLEAIAWHELTIDPVAAERGALTAVEGDELACAAGDEAVVPLGGSGRVGE